jgi:drug/metabolite transporter (DMT)-like permease
VGEASSSDNVAQLENTTADKPLAAPISTEPATLRFGGADLLVLLCICIWAVNVPSVKLLLQNGFGPLEVSMIRYTIGAIFFLGLVLIREKSLRVQWRHLPLLVLAGIVGITLNQVFFVYALENTTSSEVSLLMASTPTFAALLAWLIGQEKIRLNFWISLPLAIAGVFLIVITAPGAHLGGGLWGDALALFTSASWAGYTVMIRPLIKHYSVARISAYVLFIGVLAMLPFGLPQMNTNHYANLAPSLWLTLAYCTFGALILTNFLWYGGVKHLGAPRTAFYAYFQPFGGVIAAALILGEVVVPWQVMGGILVVFSMILYRSNLSRLFHKVITRAKS